MTSLSLKGKTALVTGASRGIGREIALTLGKAGTLVFAHYGQRQAGADEVVAEIQAAGGKAIAIGADLRNLAAIDAMFAAIDGELSGSRLDILINNAGVGGGGTVESVDPDAFDRLFETNVKGLFFVSQQAVPRIADGGRIINISSMVSLAAYPGSIAYAMSKASVNSFTRSLAAHLGSRGITVNAVAPGATDTDFIRALMDNPELKEHYAARAALGRIGTVKEIANAVAFLASEEGRWITGQVIQASGGMHL